MKTEPNNEIKSTNKHIHTRTGRKNVQERIINVPRKEMSVGVCVCFFFLEPHMSICSELTWEYYIHTSIRIEADCFFLVSNLLKGHIQKKNSGETCTMN